MPSLYLALDGDLDAGKQHFEHHTSSDSLADGVLRFVVDIEAVTANTAAAYAAEMQTWRPSDPRWRGMVLGPRDTDRYHPNDRNTKLWTVQIHAVPPSDRDYDTTPRFPAEPKAAAAP